MDLPHYWKSLPTDSPLKETYAPPAVPGVNYWGALGAVIVGILAVSSGAVLVGLLVAAGGLAWGAFLHKVAGAADAQLASWNGSRVCLVCTGTF